MAETIRKQMLRRCRTALDRLKQTEAALCEVDQLHKGRSETVTAMAPVILRSTELLIELWEKMRSAI